MHKYGYKIARPLTQTPERNRRIGKTKKKIESGASHRMIKRDKLSTIIGQKRKAKQKRKLKFLSRECLKESRPIARGAQIFSLGFHAAWNGASRVGGSTAGKREVVEGTRRDEETKEKEYEGERGLEKRGRVTVEEKGRAEGVRAVDTSTRARHAWLVRAAPISQHDG